MSRDGDGGDASGSPGRSDRIAAVHGAMPAPQRCSLNAGDNIGTATPASMPQAQPETSRRLEIGGSSSMAEAVIDETASPMTSSPRADSVLLRYSGLGRGALQESEGGEGTTLIMVEDDTQLRAPMDTNLVEETGRRATMRNDGHLARGPAVASDWPAIGDSTAPPLQQMHDVKVCQLEIAQPRQPVEFPEIDESARSMPSPHEMPMPSLPTGSAPVHDVWEETAPMAFAEISAMMKSGGEFLIGLDSEFAVRDGAVLPGREPPTADEHYQQLCTIVNGGNLVQLGLAIADARFHVLGIWQFNMKFSVKWRKPWHAGVVFLRDTAKLSLQEHEKRGVNPSEFIVWFTGSGMLKNVNITWITFNGYSDYGLLIRLMDGKDMLPPKRLQFLNVFWTIFPRTYDLRVFTKLGRCRKTVIDGGLAKVCEALGVRIVGETHHAGTDALSAIRCMERLISVDPEFSQRMVRYSGVLYGVVVDAW